MDWPSMWMPVRSSTTVHMLSAVTRLGRNLLDVVAGYLSWLALPLSTDPGAWVQRVVQPVAQEVDGQRGDTQHHRGHSNQVRPIAPLVQIVIDHRTPTGRRRLDTDTQIAEGRLENHSRGKTERRRDDDRS